MFGNERVDSQILESTVHPFLFIEKLPGTIHLFLPCSIPPLTALVNKT